MSKSKKMTQRLRRAMKLQKQQVAREQQYDRYNELLECFREGRLERGRELAARYVETYPTDADGWSVLAQFLSKLGRLIDAALAQRQAWRLGPDEPIHCYNYAYMLSATGRFGEAEELLRRALSVDPQFRDARKLLDGIAEMKQNAKKVTLSLDEDKVLSDLFDEAKSLMLEERYAEAIETYDRVLERSEIKAPVLNDKGLCLMALRRYQEAADCFTAAIQHEDNDVLSVLNRAIAYARLGEARKMEADIALAATMKPVMARDSVRAAGAFGALGRHELALRYAKEGLKQQKDDDTLRATYAAALFNTGKRDDAMDMLRKASTRNPGTFLGGMLKQAAELERTGEEGLIPYPFRVF